MSVSVLFSIATFHQQADDLNRRFGRFQSIIRQYQDFYPGRPPGFFSGVPDISDTLNQLKINLLYLNLVILGLSAAAGYFLAGRTLLPIQKSLDDQARFVADASHEIRTPLAALKISTEVALRDKNLTGKDVHALLSSNLQKINDLQGLTESLLKLSSDSKAGRVFEHQVYLSDVVSDAVSQVELAATAKQVKINADVSKVVVTADPKSLSEVLVVLFDNAIKYNSVGTAIRVSAHSNDHSVVITIADDGSGISSDDLPHIFDRFYRADLSRSKEIPGYGLGLSIAKQIIGSHSGSIEVASSSAGTEFTVRLPQN
jgi:signal transduction histidine kinase